MKKLILLLFTASLIISCTTIRQLSNQKIASKIGCSNNDFKEKMIYYTAKIDGKDENFLFDTGATMTVITDSTAITEMENKKFGNFGTITGADKKTIDLKTFTAKFESDLFYSDNKAFAYVPKQITKCQQKENYKGILGLDVLFNNDAVFMLDFTNKKICNIESERINNFESLGYNEIKSICKSKQIYLFLTIENIEYKFKLDTGFVGSLVIPFSKEIDFSKYNSIILEGNLYKTIASSTNGEEIFYENVPFKFGNNTINSKIQVSKTIKAQNLGMSFIKGFDWIIDYKNNKVYIKKNSNIIENMFNKNLFSYQCAEKNSKLIICTKQKKLNKYNLGDEITAVNNDKITSANICEMQDLLNKSKDWTSLNIDISKVK